MIYRFDDGARYLRWIFSPSALLPEHHDINKHKTQHPSNAKTQEAPRRRVDEATLSSAAEAM